MSDVEEPAVGPADCHFCSVLPEHILDQNELAFSVLGIGVHPSPTGRARHIVRGNRVGFALSDTPEWWVYDFPDSLGEGRGVTTNTGQRVAYIRVSSLAQNTERQLDGVDVDVVFTDKLSGKDVNRPALDEMLKHVRAGDTLLVHSMDRLARNLDDLRRLVRELTDRGVRVEFVKEGLTFTGEDSPVQELLMNVIGSVAMFERALIKERQMEGIAIAKAKGVYKGRKSALSDQQILDLRERAASGVPKAELARQFGVNRSTVYEHLKPNP